MAYILINLSNKILKLVLSQAYNPLDSHQRHLFSNDEHF